VEKAICARYKAKAGTVESLQRELAVLNLKPTMPKCHDMVLKFQSERTTTLPVVSSLTCGDRCTRAGSRHCVSREWSIDLWPIANGERGVFEEQS